MDRKGIIAVALSVIGLLAWIRYTSNQQQQYLKAKQAAEAAAEIEAKAKAKEATPPATTVSSSPGGEDAAPAAQPKVETPAIPEKLEKVTSQSVDYTFTNLGGGISHADLLNHIAEHGGQRTGDRETKVTLNEFGEIPIGAVSEHPGEETRLPFTVKVDEKAGEVTFDRTDSRQFQTVKKFTVPRNPDFRTEYLVGLDLTFTNHSQQPVKMGYYYVHTGSAGPIHVLDQVRYTGVDWFNGSNNFKSVSTFSSGGFLGFNRSDTPIFSQPVDKVDWLGVTNQYFNVIITPQNATGSAVWAQKLGVENLPPEDPRAVAAGGGKRSSNMLAIEGAIGMPGFTLEPGKSINQHFDIYAGPREFQRLKTLGRNQEAILDFGALKVVSAGLLTSLNWLKSHLGSYAAAIIALTLIIRSLMWPLQNKSTESMKKMQALSPKMNELKEKYQDDPARMNQEMMRLYKDNGVNPLSGCLPMLIQIPIFWGLFGMLGKAVELRNSQFLWIHDLSQPDTVAMVFGYPLNILPLLMAVTMFLQMKLSPKSGDASQQKVFMFMPLIFVAFCYNYASALALYWTVQNLFSIGQLYVTRNRITPVLQIPAKSGRKKGR